MSDATTEIRFSDHEYIMEDVTGDSAGEVNQRAPLDSAMDAESANVPDGGSVSFRIWLEIPNHATEAALQAASSESDLETVHSIDDLFEGLDD